MECSVQGEARRRCKGGSKRVGVWGGLEAVSKRSLNVKIIQSCAFALKSIYELLPLKHPTVYELSMSCLPHCYQWNVELLQRTCASPRALGPAPLGPWAQEHFEIF